MTDPLNTTASITVIIQFSEVARYINGSAGAVKERKQLCDEARTCEFIPQQLKDDADDVEEGNKWSGTIKALDGADVPLDRLRVALSIIKTKLEPKKSLKKAFVTLKWPFDEKEAKKIISAIKHEKTLSNLALTNNYRNLIQEIKNSNENERQLAELIDAIQKSSKENESQFAALKDLVARIQGSQADLKVGADRLRDGQDNRVADEDSTYSKVWEAMQMATVDFKLCPNRVWAVVRSYQQRENSLPQLIKSLRKNEPMVGHKNHDQCGFDFCEHSRRDFTAVAQRHESKSCADYPCKRLRYQFPMDVLEDATKAGKLTAWKLDGKSMIDPPQPFMAISHVWSDGTGTGAWKQGEVNECLYNYFRGIAKRFQCEGIWWDTICIPKDKPLAA